MEILATPITYRDGNLTDGSNAFNSDVALCLSRTRYFFDLPTKAKISRDDGAYVLSVHDRKHRNGLKVTRKANGFIRLWNERTEKWVSRAMYWSAENTLKKLFQTSGKKYLYVVIEEA